MPTLLARSSTAALVGALSVAALTVALLQTAVVPVLGVIAHQLGVSSVAVSWAVTANLLAAAAATPLIGRLADLYSKKRVLVAVLLVVAAGSLLAATTTSLRWLIVARVLQGLSFSLYPICVAILRDELPGERVVGALAVLSGTLGFGGGTGLVVTGLLMADSASYHRVFWLSLGFTLVVLVVVARCVPARPGSGTGTVDWLGALGLAVGLTAVLLAITQGNAWGWAAPATVGCAALALAVLGALTGFVTATASGRFIDRFGARPVLVTGAVSGIVGFTALALWHSSPWQVIVAGVATTPTSAWPTGPCRRWWSAVLPTR